MRKATDDPILVTDDCTQNPAHVELQQGICEKYGAQYQTLAQWGHMSGNYHQGCEQAGLLWEPDVYVILQDDFIISPRWYECLKFFWEANKDQPIGTVGTRFAQVWELITSDIIHSDSEFWDVDWSENEVHAEDVVWDYHKFVKGVDEKRITTASKFPNAEFEERTKGGEVIPSRFMPMGSCNGLHGTTNTHMTIRREAFEAIGGMKDLPLFIFDLEVGWKLWQKGYWNVLIPGPIGLHFAGQGSNIAAELGYFTDSQFAEYLWPREPAKQAFEKRWGTTHYPTIERRIIGDYVNPFNQSKECQRLSFMSGFKNGV